MEEMDHGILPPDGDLWRRRLLFLLLLPAISPAGCAVRRQTVFSPPPEVGPRGIILVADGAGNFQCSSQAFQKVIHEEQLPLTVQTFEWSHGRPRVLSDHFDSGNVRQQGQRLAQQILSLRQQYPQAEIYLVGHSDGCGVVTTAAGALPCDCVERVILLAPSLSRHYDLRPALRSVRCSLDVFYSPRDWGYLALVTGVLGTSDRCWHSASGRCGFATPPAADDDRPLYAKLQQHCWRPSDGLVGNSGGHYGAYQPEFLRRHVVPLLHRTDAPG
jgi:pimeloyl-ACP methyl ester carboxylesterase